MVDLTVVEIRHSLALDVKKNEVKSQIKKRINELGLDLAVYRNNNEFLLLILNLIEHLIVKRDNINKKELALEILHDLFAINAIERQTYDTNIEFLWSNKAIKKVSKWKLFKAGVCEWFFRKDSKKNV